MGPSDSQDRPRARLIAAALVWLGAALMLLVRGVLFVETPGPDFHPNWALVPIAVVAGIVGVVKARLILVDYARANVERVLSRQRACFFGFFSPTSWVFITVMMEPA